MVRFTLYRYPVLEGNMRILTRLLPDRARHPGVYRIRNTVTGCVYIGATTRPMRARWRQHADNLRAKRHSNRRMQADWIEYGESAFVFEVVEVVRRGDVFQRERHWQDLGFTKEGRYNPSNQRPRRSAPRERSNNPELQRLTEMLAALTDDEMLRLLALLRLPNGAWRFEDRRIARFIGGGYERRLAQVRAARGEA